MSDLTLDEMIDKYEAMEVELQPLLAAKAALEAAIKNKVLETGSTKGNLFSYQVKVRKSTDHEAAALEYGVGDDIIQANSTTKTTVRWAGVTKAAKVPKDILDKHTSEGEPSVTIGAL